MEIGVRRGTGRGDQIAEGVVLLGIGDGSGGIGEHADSASAVVHIEAGRGRVVNGLELADAQQTVGVLPRNLPVDQFLDDLRVAGGGEIVDQVLRGDAVDGVRDELAQAVVDKRAPLADNSSTTCG